MHQITKKNIYSAGIQLLNITEDIDDDDRETEKLAEVAQKRENNTAHTKMKVTTRMINGICTGNVKCTGIYIYTACLRDCFYRPRDIGLVHII